MRRASLLKAVRHIILKSIIGGVAMNKKDSTVKEMKIGNSSISIADDFFRDKTQDEVDRIIKELSQAVRRAL